MSQWLPDALQVRLGGLVFLVLHRGGKPERLDEDVQALVTGRRPDVLVFGHSHRPGRCVRDRVLRVNPGSAGPRRFSLPRCLAVLTVTRGAGALRYSELPAG